MWYPIDKIDSLYDSMKVPPFIHLLVWVIVPTILAHRGPLRKGRDHLINNPFSSLKKVL